MLRQKPMEHRRIGGIARAGPRRKEKVLNRLLEHPLIRRVSFEEYREKVRHVYDGPQGAMLATCSLLSLHTALGERLFRERKFDLRGARNILDVGSGAGQLARHVLKYADPESRITCFDLSHEMLRRARHRLRSPRPRFVAADLTPAALSRRQFRLRHLRLRAGAPARRPAGPERAGPGDDARREDAPVDHGGQFLGGLDEPRLVLPDLQSPGIRAGFARAWACTGSRSCGIRGCTRCCGPAASAWSWSRTGAPGCCGGSSRVRLRRQGAACGSARFVPLDFSAIAGMKIVLRRGVSARADGEPPGTLRERDLRRQRIVARRASSRPTQRSRWSGPAMTSRRIRSDERVRCRWPISTCCRVEVDEEPPGSPVNLFACPPPAQVQRSLWPLVFPERDFLVYSPSASVGAGPAGAQLAPDQGLPPAFLPRYQRQAVERLAVAGPQPDPHPPAVGAHARALRGGARGAGPRRGDAAGEHHALLHEPDFAGRSPAAAAADGHPHGPRVHPHPGRGRRPAGRRARQPRAGPGPPLSGPRAAAGRWISARATAATAPARGWWGRARSSPTRSGWSRPWTTSAARPAIRDVLLSGGDPLFLSDERLDWILTRLRAIPHVEFVRIGTKMPAVLPQRITRELCRMLRKHHPLWMSLHFVHPDECTPGDLPGLHPAGRRRHPAGLADGAAARASTTTWRR